MKSIALIVDRDRFPEGEAGNEAWAEAAQARIVSAYAAVFTANATKDDVDLVLVDLAQCARYYDTASLNASPETAVALNHRRAPITRILDALATAGVEPSGLRTAVLLTPSFDPEEGA